jgi:hypothetical protein
MRMFIYSGYFFPDCHVITPPTVITAIPSKGVHLRLCLLFAVMLISPIFATLSLVKKVTVVKMVNTKPIKMSTIPNFFILNFIIYNLIERYAKLLEKKLHNSL